MLKTKVLFYITLIILMVQSSASAQEPPPLVEEDALVVIEDPTNRASTEDSTIEDGSTTSSEPDTSKPWLERYQTLVTGILAIAAAIIAFLGSIIASRIQAKATSDATQESIKHASSEAGDERKHQESLRSEASKQRRQSLLRILNNEASLIAQRMQRHLSDLDSAGTDKLPVQTRLQGMRTRGAEFINLDWETLSHLDDDIIIALRQLSYSTEAYSSAVDIAIDLKKSESSTAEVETQSRSLLNRTAGSVKSAADSLEDLCKNSIQATTT